MNGNLTSWGSTRGRKRRVQSSADVKSITRDVSLATGDTPHPSFWKTTRTEVVFPSNKKKEGYSNNKNKRTSRTGPLNQRNISGTLTLLVTMGPLFSFPSSFYFSPFSTHSSLPLKAR